MIEYFLVAIGLFQVLTFVTISLAMPFVKNVTNIYREHETRISRIGGCTIK